ncbi:biotin transporter BioY [Rhodovibrionaceae bacterium A322]
MHVSGSYPTLAASLWPAQANSSLARNLLLMVVGSAFLALASQISVPMFPVPMTLQTFAVLTIGLAFGSRLAAATVALYLMEGAMGLPVFAGGKFGLVALTGTTGGYLIGFVFAAGLVGWLAEKGWDRSVLTTAFALLLGNIVLYVPGILWLGSVVGWDKPVLEWGLTPFIIGDLVKLALAAAIFPLVWQVMKKLQAKS